MLGWAQWYRPVSIANRQEAERSFGRALALDPRSVDAKIGLAAALASLVGIGGSSSVEQDEARAEQLLLDALGRDPSNSMARFAMGLLRRVENRLVEAKTEAEAAVALDGNNAWAQLHLGYVLTLLGRPQAGIVYTEQVIRLNPRDEPQHPRVLR